MSYFLLFLILSSYVLQSECAFQLIWSDDFNGSAVDTTNWNIGNTNVVYNNEMEAYSPTSVSVYNGSLELTAVKQTYLGQPYTSGWVDTENKAYFTYGRFEARMKLPKGKGFWPAFWLWPNDEGLPYREIDIMEAIGSQTTTIETTCWVAGADYSNDLSSGFDYTMPADFSLDYHIYAVEWSPGELDYYVDSTKVFSCLKSQFTAWDLDLPTNQMFIILNLAVGGDMPGSPSSSTPFPSSVLVDYVRVYQDPTVVGNVAKIVSSSSGSSSKTSTSTGTSSTGTSSTGTSSTGTSSSGTSSSGTSSSGTSKTSTSSNSTSSNSSSKNSSSKSSSSKSSKPVSAISCNERYSTTHLKSSVRFLKTEGPVPTSAIATIQVGSGNECCDRCNNEENCVAWKFNRGKCSLLEKKEQ